MVKRRKSRRRADAMRGKIALASVFALLVGVNFYVFFVRPGNVNDLRDKVAEGRISAPQALPLAQVVAVAPKPPGGGGVLGELNAKLPAAASVVDAPAPKAGRSVEGKVEPNDTMGKIFERQGLTRTEAAEVLGALQGTLDVKAIRAGQVYVLTLDDEGDLTAFEFRVSPATIVRVERDGGGKLKARRAESKTEVRVEDVSGTVVSSLYESVKAGGGGTALVADIADLFAGDINFYVDTHPGDRFAVRVEKLYLDGQFWKYGKILAAEYAGKVGSHRAFWYQGDGVPRGAYFDDKGRSLTKSMLKTPLKFARMSSGFNPRRMHRVLHRVKGHFGTDYAAPVGTPVWAAGGGRVISAGWGGGAGNLVVIDHGAGLVTYYMHLSRFAKGLRAGQRIDQKQVIGFVGTTGLSTGPHLHFGVKQGGKWIDSTRLTPRRASPVPQKAMAAFQAQIAPHVAALTTMKAPPGALTAGVATSHAQ
jgi:murein DD-endopeptidase MepM/ murein hydrolase activator NlpD